MSDTNKAPLTVVLVHGAFADSSSWSGVVERLQTRGLEVRRPRTRCAASRMTPRTSRPSSDRFPGPCWRSATRTEAR